MMDFKKMNVFSIVILILTFMSIVNCDSSTFNDQGGPASTIPIAPIDSDSPTPDTVPRGQVLDLVVPSTGASFALYIPHSITTLTSAPVVYTIHGTSYGPGADNSHLIEMGPNPGYDAGSLWDAVAEREGFIVVAPNNRFGRRGDWNSCLLLDDFHNFIVLIHYLDQLGLTGSEKFVTGFSSGTAIASMTAFIYPELFRALILRHTTLASASTLSNAIAELDYAFNKHPAFSYSISADGICTQTQPGPEVQLYNWKTSIPLKTLAIHVITGSEEPGGQVYYDQTMELFNYLGTSLGFYRAGLTQDHRTDLHSHHSEDRDLVGDWIRIFRATHTL